MAKKAAATVGAPQGSPSLPPMPERVVVKLPLKAKSPQRRPSIDYDPEEVAKLEDQLGAEAVSEMEGLDMAELRERLVTLAEHEVETEQAMKKDEKLQELKAEIREVQAPYKETLKLLKVRRRLSVLYMQKRGAPVSS